MAESLANLIGDGDGPAIAIPREVTSGVRVGREGELVTLTIGHHTVRFKSRDAMMIGQWLMSKGYEARMLVGDAKRVVIEPGRNKL